jgi:hypothetical protein
MSRLSAIFALIAAVIGLTAASVHRHREAQHWAHVAADTVRTPGMAGEVHCVDNQPHVLPAVRTLTGLARDENALHESMHAEQFKASCDATRARWASDPLFALDLEAQAYCYGMQVYRDPAYVAQRRGDEIRLLLALWRRTVVFGDVYSALSRWCS